MFPREERVGFAPARTRGYGKFVPKQGEGDVTAQTPFDGMSIGRTAEISGEFEPAKIAAQDDVDDPADRIAPILTSRRRGEHFDAFDLRSEEHTSELQSLMRISYAVFCFKKKKKQQT